MRLEGIPDEVPKVEPEPVEKAMKKQFSVIKTSFRWVGVAYGNPRCLLFGLWFWMVVIGPHQAHNPPLNRTQKTAPVS